MKWKQETGDGKWETGDGKPENVLKAVWHWRGVQAV